MRVLDHHPNNWPGSRTTPHQEQFPTGKNKAQSLPTGTTIPRTIPHQDKSPLGPLPWNKTIHQDQYLYGGILSWWGVVWIRIDPINLDLCLVNRPFQVICEEYSGCIGLHIKPFHKNLIRLFCEMEWDLALLWRFNRVCCKSVMGSIWQ